jgi:Na+/H+ antiporter NhaA
VAAVSGGDAGTSETRGGRTTAWARGLGTPVRDFLGAETGGAAVLLAAALAALVWANVSAHSYESVWNTSFAIKLGSHSVSASLRDWIDEGLMTIFFLVVGLEAKRELSLGELRERRRIAIPVVAACGGMVFAVGAYLAVAAGTRAAHGWGVAFSTDTALALGALALVAPRGNTRLRVFLLTLVVFDDLVGLLVIAFAYTHHVSVVALIVALGLFAGLALLRFLPRGRAPLAVLVGVGVWLAMFESGIDPVIAGLAIGLVASAYPPSREDLERAIELTRSFREQPTPELAESAQRGLAAAISPNERLQHRLHPWSGYVLVPLFALANMGVHIDGALLKAAVSSPVTIGIVLAYVIGKPLGIIASSWIGTRKVFGASKLTVTWPGLAGTGAAAGVGFTVSLLVARRAFGAELLAEAQIGVIAVIVLSPLAALAVFRITALLPEATRARQLGATAHTLIDLADDVDPGRDHVRGAHDATVTLVEYADFECPYCGRAEPAIRGLLAEQGEVLRYVFRHLPLHDVHPRAQVAAEAAEAAGAQGAFWELHDLLFEHQEALTPRDLRRYAEELGLDMERFEADLYAHVYEQRVEQDVASADASGVSGTPSFFINGRRHHGAYDLEALTAAVATARAAARAKALRAQA